MMLTSAMTRDRMELLRAMAEETLLVSSDIVSWMMAEKVYITHRESEGEDMSVGKCVMVEETLLVSSDIVSWMMAEKVYITHRESEGEDMSVGKCVMVEETLSVSSDIVSAGGKLV